MYDSIDVSDPDNRFHSKSLVRNDSKGCAQNTSPFIFGFQSRLETRHDLLWVGLITFGEYSVNILYFLHRQVFLISEQPGFLAG